MDLKQLMWKKKKDCLGEEGQEYSCDPFKFVIMLM